MNLAEKIALAGLMWLLAGLLVALWFHLGGIGTPDDHEIDNGRRDS